MLRCEDGKGQSRLVRFSAQPQIQLGGALGIGEEGAPTRLPDPARAEALPVVGDAFAMTESRKELRLPRPIAFPGGEGALIAEEATEEQILILLSRRRVRHRHHHRAHGGAKILRLPPVHPRPPTQRLSSAACQVSSPNTPPWAMRASATRGRVS